MKLRQYMEEDLINYKKISLFLGTCYCDWKCCHEGHFAETICQNNPLATSVIKEIDNNKLIKRYLSNSLTSAIVFGGLEPFKQFEELLEFVKTLREQYNCMDDVVIYTGYYKEEIIDKIELLSKYKNIIIKFGRYIPGQSSHYDDVLGVNLASNNQYAEKIS